MSLSFNVPSVNRPEEPQSQQEKHADKLSEFGREFPPTWVPGSFLNKKSMPGSSWLKVLFKKDAHTSLRDQYRGFLLQKLIITAIQIVAGFVFLSEHEIEDSILIRIFDDNDYDCAKCTFRNGLFCSRQVLGVMGPLHMVLKIGSLWECWEIRGWSLYLWRMP
jgi:hypothetical protein